MRKPETATSPVTDERLWTPKEAAAYLGMSERWLRASSVPKVILPGRRSLGKRPRLTVRYLPSQVRAWVERQLTSRVKVAA
jgi:predicted DNA-binding transcriptional regulator AlpA